MASSKETTFPIFIVDAFTKEAFKGNPAAVCLLGFEQDVPPETRQRIAAEMNLSETAFVSPVERDSTFEKGCRFALQWFSPTCEVPLCGHATLATSAVIFSVCSNPSDTLEFQTRSGTLRAKRFPDGRTEVDLPAYESGPVEKGRYEAVVQEVSGGLPVREVLLSASGKLLVRLEDGITGRDLSGLSPRSDRLLSAGVDLLGAIVTTRGTSSDPLSDSGGRRYDFVSRYFCPWLGIPEDPVTGSAHSVLAPFWSKVLGKDELYARQCSPRGGELSVRLSGDRVFLAGHAVVVVRGRMRL